MFATLLCTYVISSSLTMLLTLALRDNLLAVLHGLATLVQMSIAVHIAVTFGLLIGAIVVYGRGGWSFEKRIGRVSVRGWSRIPPSPLCMARPRRLRRSGGKPCSR